jgi:hypothetical protein
MQKTKRSRRERLEAEAIFASVVDEGTRLDLKEQSGWPNGYLSNPFILALIGDSKSVAPQRQDPGAVPWEQLNNSWLAGRLKEASRKGDAQSFGLFLYHLITKMGIDPPSGVFKSRLQLKPSKLGRPISGERELIFDTWFSLGCPSLYKNDLADAVYGKKFRDSDAVERKNLVNKCRRMVEREREAWIQKIPLLEAKLAELRKPRTQAG